MQLAEMKPFKATIGSDRKFPPGSFSAGRAKGVGVGVGQVLIWLSGIDTECELAVPAVMTEPGEAGRALEQQISRKRGLQLEQ